MTTDAAINPMTRISETGIETAVMPELSCIERPQFYQESFPTVGAESDNGDAQIGLCPFA